MAPAISASCGGPLHKAEIAGAIGGECSGEPGLLLQPCYRRQAILVFANKRFKLPTGTEGTARTLDHYLVTAFGKQPSIDEPEEAASPIAAADQDHRQSLATAWNIAICQQHDAIGHRYLQVAFHDHV